MSGLKLLLTTAATAMDQLCLARMRSDTGILTPEYRDPSLRLALDEDLHRDDAAACERLARIVDQLRNVGPVASAHAIMDQPAKGRRQIALLALAGAGNWRMTALLPHGGQIHRRCSADGHVYLLAGAPAAATAHAPHAMRDYAEHLWILPEGHPCAGGLALPDEHPLISSRQGPDSLSLDAALRDLLIELTAAGAEILAHQVAMLCQGIAAPASADPIFATPRQHPAVAA